jgi:phthalate 4,5-dioxygenase
LPATNEPYSFIRPRAIKANDYLMNWDVHRRQRMGITGVNLQDRCVTENEGPTPILDRSKENLCSGDYATIKARRMLLSAAKALRDHGTPPPGVRDPGVYRVRAAAKVVPDSIPWVEGVKSDILMSGSTALVG